MKLNEILNENVPIATTTIDNRKMSKFDNMTTGDGRVEPYTDISSKHRNNVAGAGIEAIVFKSQKPSHMGTVTKFLTDQRNPYTDNASVQYLIQSQQWNTTFVPRVYKIKQIYNNSDATYEFAIEMERLPFTLKQYIIDNFDDRLLLTTVLKQFIKPSYVSTLLDTLTKINISAIIRDEEKFNDNFSSIINRINQIGNEYSAVDDFHADNIMIRLTSVGPQVVITDPLIH